MCHQAFRRDSCIKILICLGKPMALLTQGKYGRRLYCDHVTKSFWDKGININWGQSCTDATWMTHFKDKAFQSHDHNTGGDHTCPVLTCYKFDSSSRSILP